MDLFDVVVIGAGAAGMMCAIEAGKRGRSVLVVDHAAKAGEIPTVKFGRTIRVPLVALRKMLEDDAGQKPVPNKK